MQSCVKTVPPSSGNHPQKVPLTTPKMHSFNQPFPKPDRNVLHYSVQFRSCPKLGGAGDKFGDYLCVDCANLPCVRGNNQLTNTTFTTHITKISSSSIQNSKIYPHWRQIQSWKRNFHLVANWEDDRERTHPFISCEPMRL